MGKNRSRGPGRPPAGPGGEKVSKYPQLTIRLPAQTKARLSTLSLLTGNPIWRIIDQAVDAYVQHLPEPERGRLGEIAERLVRGDWPVTSHWEAAWPNWRSSQKPRRQQSKPRAPVDVEARERKK
jgi:predicted DNA-binding protein